MPLSDPSRDLPDGPAGLGEQLRACLRRYLSRGSAEIVLRRGTSLCATRPDALTVEQAPRFLEGAERALAGYLDGQRLHDARRSLRTVLARAGARLTPLSPSAGQAPDRSCGPTSHAPAHRESPQAQRAPLPLSTLMRVQASRTPLAPVEIPVAKDADLEVARSECLRFARAAGMGPVDTVKVATVASELARNILQYAGVGRVRYVLRGEPSRAMQVIAVDEGPGIQDVETILAGQYRSPTGMGLGIHGSRKLMDRLEVATVPGRGTTVTAEKAF